MALTVGMTHEQRLKTGPEHSAQKIYLRSSRCLQYSLSGRIVRGRERGLDGPPSRGPGGTVGGDLHGSETYRRPRRWAWKCGPSPRLPRWKGGRSPSRWRGSTQRKDWRGRARAVYNQCREIQSAGGGEKELSDPALSLDFPYDLVTLGHFEAGSGWEAQVRQYVRKKYRQDLAGLAGLDPGALAGLFGGNC